MAFFDELGRMITDAGQGVAQSTKNYSDVRNLTSAIESKTKEVAGLYASLGKLYYEGHSRDPKAEGAALIGAINTLKEDIERCQEEIRRIKGFVQCPGCGANVPQEAAFCASCGATMPRAVAASAAPAVSQHLCPNCGKAVNDGNRFCNFCGAKME